MNTLIDSHVHFWDRERFRYAWLDDVPEPLSRPTASSDRGAAAPTRSAQRRIAASAPHARVDE